MRRVASVDAAARDFSQSLVHTALYQQGSGGQGCKGNRVLRHGIWGERCANGPYRWGAVPYLNQRARAYIPVQCGLGAGGEPGEHPSLSGTVLATWLALLAGCSVAAAAARMLADWSEPGVLSRDVSTGRQGTARPLCKSRLVTVAGRRLLMRSSQLSSYEFTTASSAQSIRCKMPLISHDPSCRQYRRRQDLVKVGGRTKLHETFCPMSYIKSRQRFIYPRLNYRSCCRRIQVCLERQPHKVAVKLSAALIEGTRSPVPRSWQRHCRC